MKNYFRILSFLLLNIIFFNLSARGQSRITLNFNQDWRFFKGDEPNASAKSFNDKGWRTVQLPHDWSIEGSFSDLHPATVGGGALPGGTGWYRKSFVLPEKAISQLVAIGFDGVYRNSEVWINGHYLGKRPNGYISFEYDLTPFLVKDGENQLAVRVDNSQQPNARWYTGSGIYRDVQLIIRNPVHLIQSGIYVSTPSVSQAAATIRIEASLAAVKTTQTIQLKHQIIDAAGKIVQEKTSQVQITNKQTQIPVQMELKDPQLWSDTSPYLYRLRTTLWAKGKELDRYDTTLGIRSFSFDAQTGFQLNGKSMKIKGVCNHHDLGALGTAFNRRAAQRQLQILKEMGVNGLRTAHNPPAAALLDLCDEMGFIVMNEAFDMWEKKKSDFDYHLDFKQWHQQDLEDQVKRDRNHPSVFIWSVGNEIQEQWGTDADTLGRVWARKLVKIVKDLDPARPVTTANNEINSYNNLIQSGAMDLIGYNYNHKSWDDFTKTYPGQKLIATETTSALQTRGQYDAPADSMRIWPTAWDKPLLTGNADFSCSAYDNCFTPWGSSHEETLKAFHRNPAVSGIYVWTGFDYLGEPTPYTWPARSSYFGIIDLAGFPKDVYYLYQSVWTDKPVLHLLPHWNWKKDQTVDVIAYYSQADEVELFLNGVSQGIRRKNGEELKVSWKLNYQAGELKAVSRKNGKTILEKLISTAGPTAKLELLADRNLLEATGNDLSFVTIRVLDAAGNLVPDADQAVKITVKGVGKLAATDNGSPVSHASFLSPEIKAFNGLALAIIQAGQQTGSIEVEARMEGFEPVTLRLEVQ